MKKEFNVIIEEGEDCYYVSEVVELPGCHTQAKLLDELLTRTRKAIELYLETEEDDFPVGRFLGIQKICL
jgi:predicted RNase H-like HicB family nuclease